MQSLTQRHCRRSYVSLALTALAVAVFTLLGCRERLDLHPEPDPARSREASLDVEPAPPPGGPGRGCDDGNPCTKDKLDAAGHCTHEPLTGKKCDDGNACTSKDQCVLGHAAPVCAGTPAPAGSSCDEDADACNGGGICNGEARCLRTRPPTIDDGNPCTTDTCNPKNGKITHEVVPAGTACSDGDACTTNDTCKLLTGSANPFALSCSGNPIAVDDDNPCTADSCDRAAGAQHEALPAGSACGDANPCNGADACDGEGTCVASPPLEPGAYCEQENPCAGRCGYPDPAVAANLSCVVAPSGSPCSDGEACNGSETCDGAGTCQLGDGLADGARGATCRA